MMACQAAHCGATWVVFALAIIALPIIRMGYGACYQSSKIIDSGHFQLTPKELEENRQSAIDARCVELFGPVLAVLGTILWAYGDLAANAVEKPLAFKLGHYDRSCNLAMTVIHYRFARFGAGFRSRSLSQSGNASLTLGH
jgi:hypothetical protein